MVTLAQNPRTRFVLPIMMCCVIAGCASDSESQGASTPIASTPTATATAPATSEPATTPDQQGRQVRLTRGSSAPDTGCSDPSCAFLDIEVSGFPANAIVRFQPADSAAGTDGWPSTTRRTAGDGSYVLTEYYFFGFPGRDVWVSVDGVESNRLTW